MHIWIITTITCYYLPPVFNVFQKSRYGFFDSFIVIVQVHGVSHLTEIFNVLQNIMGLSLNLLEARWSRATLSTYILIGLMSPFSLQIGEQSWIRTNTMNWSNSSRATVLLRLPQGLTPICLAFRHLLRSPTFNAYSFLLRQVGNGFVLHCFPQWVCYLLFLVGKNGFSLLQSISF